MSSKQNAYILLNSHLYLNTNTNLYDQNAAQIISNYWININIGNFDAFFSKKVYQENLLDANLVNIDIAVNTALLKERIVGDFSDPVRLGEGAGDSLVGYLTGTEEPLGFRLLEIAAESIFGHARARAAISNDTDYITATLPATYYNVYNGGSDQVNASILNILEEQVTKAFNSDISTIFNQYVDFNRDTTYGGVDLNQNDINGPVTFNFDELRFQFLLTFVSDVRSNSLGDLIHDRAQGIPASFTKTIAVQLYDGDNGSS